MFKIAIPVVLAAVIGASIGGKTSPQGAEIHVDLPNAEHMNNVGGSDGAGLCVFTSTEHSAKWSNVETLFGFRDWMRQYPGGGWPEKLDAKIRELSTQRGQLVPKFVQFQGKAGDLLPIVEHALKTNRMPAVTYGFSPSGRYGGRRIAHMVNCVHLDAKSACVLDNNYPGVDKYEWMTRDELGRTITSGGAGWVVVLLDPGPPPLPHNTK